MAFKIAHRARHKKQAWSESNRESYRKLKLRNSSEEVGTERCEISIQRICRPNTTNPPGPNLGLTKSIGAFRPVGKWVNYTTENITRSSPLMIQAPQKNILRRTSSVALTQSVLLPPINGSCMTPDEVACSSTHASPSHPVKPEEPKAKLKTTFSSLNKENTFLRLCLTQRNDTIIPKSNLIRGSLTVRKLQDSIKNLTSRADALGRSVRANEKPNAQPTAASCSAPLNLSGKQQEPDQGNPRANACMVTTHGTDGATGRSEPKQIKELSYDASNIETEFQCTGGKDGSEVIPETLFSPEEEYYTHQRITEWVLKVNACMFAPSSESMRSMSPREEQDTAIKIVYEGD